MIESVSIRRAGGADIPAIIEIQNHVLKVEQDPHRSYVHDEWLAFFNDSHIFTYLSETDQPFGFVTAGVPLDDLFLGEGQGELIALNILPTHWGHGYGKKLLVHGLSVLKRRNFKQAILWVTSGNERAVSIIRRLGFNANGAERITNRADSSIQEHCYELTLEEYF